MQSWRRSTGWQGMPWQSTIEPSKRLISFDSLVNFGNFFLSQVDAKEQAEVYNIYLRKAAEIYGVTRTRQIYEKAIETLKEADSRDMCIRFSQLFLLQSCTDLSFLALGLPRWRRSLVRLTELAQSILMQARCAILGSLSSSGRSVTLSVVIHPFHCFFRCGRTLRLSMGTRTL